jgi:hypothetical protein
VKRAWAQIISIWTLVAVMTLVVTIGSEPDQALAWYGAILAGSIASVCLIHLVKASATGIVTELIYVAGGEHRRPAGVPVPKGAHPIYEPLADLLDDTPPLTVSAVKGQHLIADALTHDLGQIAALAVIQR